MNLRYAGHEAKRYAAALDAPLLLLGLATLAAAVDWPEGYATIELPLLETLHTFSVIAALANLAWGLIAALGQPRRDAAHARRLDYLRLCATYPGWHLWQVLGTRYATRAGQQAVVLNVANGHTAELWFPETRYPDGAFVLTCPAPGSPAVDWLSVEAVMAADRSRARSLFQRQRAARAAVFR